LLLGVWVGCAREAREPVELDLTSFGATLVDGRPQATVVETAGMHRRLVVAPGSAVELYVRMPDDARVRFTVDPRTADEAFAVSARAGSEERWLAVRRSDDGDCESAVDVGEPGEIVRLRFENRGTAPLDWWGLRLTGTVRPEPAVLGAELRPPPGALNVIVLVSDALRADHLSLHGYRRPTTPELGRLAAAHGIVFEHAYAPGPSTPSSIPTLFTSRYPSALGLNFRAVAGAGDRTLAEAMSLGGVRTAAFVANPLLLPEFGYARGFGAFDVVRTGVERPRYPPAAVLVDRALEYLSVNREAPCFVYVHLMDTHTPFDPPPPHRDRFAGDERARPSDPRRASEPVLPVPTGIPRPGPWLPPVLDDAGTDPDRYDEAILAVDEQLARLVRGLETLGLRDRTAVVLTADHGEALGPEDDGRYLHGHALFDELVHVPLVFLLPWVAGERRVGDVVGHLDLAPTLVDLMGLAAPESFVGTSHFRPRTGPDPRAVLLERLEPHWTTHRVLGEGVYGVAEWGLREGRWKVLVENHRVRLYDLSADPKETADVSGRHPDLTAYLAGRIMRTSPAFTRRGRPVPIDPAAGGLDRPLAEALKALGYIAE
jgi:arylsulfatase A-like enzyme